MRATGARLLVPTAFATGLVALVQLAADAQARVSFPRAGR